MEIDEDLIDLVRAFDEARLAALHIDMQTCFYFTYGDRHLSHRTDYAFPKVNKFAAQLRTFKVPNNWVAYTDR
ncbi:MAG: hypothetical protein AAF988_02220 [Pseudomonadota bacterium]